MDQLWKTQFLGNSLVEWGLALLTFLVTVIALPVIRGYVAARRRRWLEQGRALPEAISFATLLVERTSRLFLVSVALFFASRNLEFPPRVERWLETLIILVFWLQIGLWATAALSFLIDRGRRRSRHLDVVLANSLNVVKFVCGVVIWTMVALLALDNLGVQIKPLLAGLGIGGIAVALAVQTVLGDLLASVSIALDQPFVVGDLLLVDEVNGTVEHIGVKSTRLRSVNGEQIIISNADLLKSRVRNFGRMTERRAVFQFGVHYDNPTELLAAIPAAVRAIIEAQPDARFERCHFLTYGDNALRYEAVYFLKRPEFRVYADTQQAINLAVLDRLREMGVQFAAASQGVVYLHPHPDSAAPASAPRS
jgi:small-conductance mechanosensitive channel